MSSSQIKGEEEEAGPAAASAATTATTAGRDDDSDQRGEEGQPHAQHIWRQRQSFRRQDRSGGTAVEGKRSKIKRKYSAMRGV